MINGKKMLVVSAHAADYVWRAGGPIAKYIKHGAEVHLVVLSFGGRGESNDLWKQPGATAESVKAVRRAELRQRRISLESKISNSGICRITPS